MDYLSLRKKVIKKYFNKMNDRQFEAVTTVNGPVLVLAGAGSGKTTVLVNRILNLVKFGNGYNSTYIPNVSEADIQKGIDYLNGDIDYVPNAVFGDREVKPWQILAITFTNKAAGELKERIAQKLGDDAQDIWAGTFHSVCGKILRRNAERLGFTSHFTVYDTDDQRRLMKDIMKQNDIDDKFVPHKYVLSAISHAKDSLISPEEFEATNANDFRLKTVARLYKLYQERLAKADAMDFDDMIVNTVRLLEQNDDILDYYSNKFRYVCVDEYQDTNHAQYVLVSLLASGNNNLCVVGDDDQSIYRFRGATIENILNFEDDYKGAKVIRLEQNYRSTSNILNAANKVIENNKGRKGKTLWTDNGDGEKITVHTAEDERMEARYVADAVLDNINKGGNYSDNAVLYRMNAQSNALENVFLRSGIPYKIIGGMRFYDRKEIKDVVSYLHFINNPKDDIRLRRIINEPKRGIGDTSLSHANDIANELGVSMFEVLQRADEYAALSRAASKMKAFCQMIEQLYDFAQDNSISDLFEQVLEVSGYKRMLESEGEEGLERLDNVKELASNIAQYELESEAPSLAEFLEQISLISDIDALDTESDKVVMMTIHSAKGLEFPNVFLVGMEEGIFPGSQSMYGGNEEIEEERRLAYVAITRAKKKLVISHTVMRMLFGSTNRNLPSRFLREIPVELCDNTGYLPKSYEVKSYSTSFTPTTVKKSTFTVSNSVASTTSKPTTTYSVGQMVSHKTFGEGLVLSVTPMGNDNLLEIAFQNVGTKKIMAGFAKLTII
ncbi:MAG: ATP-dependent DNA helicase PcrA [Ruminococcaceae bacterium]|nr:ATP-dependent DNA helicase PcrA [Oscillospiraceae bacterium]